MSWPLRQIFSVGWMGMGLGTFLGALCDYRLGYREVGVAVIKCVLLSHDSRSQLEQLSAI
jgi:hypothetical protein